MDRLNRVKNRILMVSCLVLTLCAFYVDTAYADNPPTLCSISPDYPVLGGWFYSQGGDGTGLGFSVVDNDSADMWTGFNRRGGVPILGYPITQPFRYKGFLMQGFQYAVLRWDPQKKDVSFVNTLDELSRLGHDDYLLSQWRIPDHKIIDYGSKLDPNSYVEFEEIKSAHLDIIKGNMILESMFGESKSWLDLYGLPVAYGEIEGTKTLRAQRAVIRIGQFGQNTDKSGEFDVPVEVLEIGSLAKDAGMFPSYAIEAHHPSGDSGRLPQIIMPNKLIQGSVGLVRLRGLRGPMSSTVNGIQVNSFCMNGEHVFFLPIPIDSRTGEQSMSIELVDEEINAFYTVSKRDVDSANIEVPRSISHLLDSKYSTEEGLFFDSVFDEINTKQLWKGTFVKPLQMNENSGFGEHRIFMPGAVHSYHTGTDFPADSETIVSSAADGIVLWVGSLPIHGNTVIVDHGLGVSTVYSHLANFSVKKGDALSVGDAVGLVGSTGRSTGAHLHWEVRVLGVPVDPNLWVQAQTIPIS